MFRSEAVARRRWNGQLPSVLGGSMRSLGAGGVSLLLMACAAVDAWRTAPALAAEPTMAVSDDPSALSRERLLAAWNSLRGDAYALDEVARRLEPGKPVICDQKGMVQYKGTTLRYAGPVLIDPAFEERLKRFELVAAEAAREVYGREPRLIRHYGAFSCRSTRNRKYRVSEHALGNALDLVGFDFGPATKAQPLGQGMPKQLRWAFQVRVARHWRPSAASGEAGALHARFLATLTERLRARDDIFRSMFGPGHGGHDDHLHLDAAPWRYVDL
jgi:hypothetical protein